MPLLNVYYAIFHVFKRYSQQLVIYLLQFSLWFSSILSSDSGMISPISSINISLTCLSFSLLSLPSRTLINGSASIVYLIGLTSQYISNTEEKKNHENYRKSRISCAPVSKSPCSEHIKKGRDLKTISKLSQEGELLKKASRVPKILKLQLEVSIS